MTIQSTRLNESVSPSGVAPAGRENASGLFLGARVTRETDPMSLLADAAKELAFSLAEGEDARLDERKEKAGPKEKERHSSKPFIVAARKLTQEADEKFGRRLNYLERLFKAKNNADLAELMEAMQKAFEQEAGSSAPDPADQFVLLARLRDRLGEDHPLAGSVDLALDDLAERHAFTVASGLAADLAGPGFAELGDLRGAYRSVVADFASPRETLTGLRARFGEDKLEQGLDFIMTVLGNELYSEGPSVDKSRLKALTGDMAMVRVLGLARALCGAALDRLDQAHGVKSRLGPDQLLDAVLTARDNQYAGSHDFQSLVQRVGLPDTKREILFLQDLLQGLRDMPDLFYEGHEARLRLQGALQSALDEAVRREEKELGF